MSNSLWPHGLQHGRLPCPSPITRAYSNSCPSNQWCHPTISSSVVPFSSSLQSLPASGSFPMSQFFASGGQRTRGKGISGTLYILPISQNHLKKKKWSRSVMSDSLRPHGQYAYQAPPSMGFSRQEYWGGLPFPSPGNLPDPGIIPRFPALQADTLPSEPPGKPQHHCTGLKSAHCPQPASYFRVSPHAPAFLTRLWTSLARDIACSSSLYSLTENLIYSRQNDQAQDNVMKH